jgi:hypothetical protein
MVVRLGFVKYNIHDPQPAVDDGQFYRLGLLEKPPTECKDLWGASSTVYFRYRCYLSVTCRVAACSSVRTAALRRRGHNHWTLANFSGESARAVDGYLLRGTQRLTAPAASA